TLVRLAVEKHRLAVEDVLVLVEVGDEVDDAALVLERVLAALGALVNELDPEVAREERGLAQALGQRLIVEDDLLEHLGVGHEGDCRTGALHLLAALEVALRSSALVVLDPGVAVAPHLEM